MTKRIDLEVVVSAHYAALYCFGLALAKNESDAADLTEQTFLTLAKHQNQIREIGKVKTWLFTTLRREFLRTVRERTSRPEVEFQPAMHETAIEPSAVDFVDVKAYWPRLRWSQRRIDQPWNYFTWATSHIRRFRMS